MSDSLEIIRGDDTTISATITNQDDEAVNLAGATVFFTVKRRKTDTDLEAVITKEVTSHTTPASGETDIELTNEDTDIRPGIYLYDLQVKDNDDRIISINYGTLRIITDITRRTT